MPEIVNPILASKSVKNTHTQTKRRFESNFSGRVNVDINLNGLHRYNC